MEHLVFTRFNMLGDTPEVYGKLMGCRPELLERAKRNMEHACEYRQRNSIDTTLGVYTCMFPENAMEILPLAEWAKNTGVDYIAVKPAGQFIDGKFGFKRNLHEDFQAQIEKCRELDDDSFTMDIRFDLFDLKNFGPNAIKRTYDKCYGIDFLGIIDADGNVGTCNGMWKNPDTQYGNLYERSFREIWSHEQRYRARDYINNKVDNHKCYVCRQHVANTFLWEIANPPDHTSFI